jgi:hypothetical protein
MPSLPPRPSGRSMPGAHALKVAQMNAMKQGEEEEEEGEDIFQTRGGTIHRRPKPTPQAEPPKAPPSFKARRVHAPKGKRDGLETDFTSMLAKGDFLKPSHQSSNLLWFIFYYRSSI